MLRLNSRLYTLFNSFFSKVTLFSIASKSVISHEKLLRICNPDETILHIHNWYNLFSQKDLKRLIKLNFRVVFTLHDQRLATGGCHYSLGCEQFQTGCTKCPYASLFFKKMVKSNAEFLSTFLSVKKANWVVIAPSIWMLDEIKKSKVLKNADIKFIPNTTGNFTEKVPLNVRTIRTNTDVWTLGIASFDPNSLIKGGDVIKRLISETQKLGIPLSFVFLKDFANNPEIFWAQIDYLFVPSRLDNSPNVIHEAKSLRIPVLASRVGGITELLFKNLDLEIKSLDLSAADLLKILETNRSAFENASLREEMVDTFSQYLHNPTQTHIALYKNLESRNLFV